MSMCACPVLVFGCASVVCIFVCADVYWYVSGCVLTCMMRLTMGYGLVLFHCCVVRFVSTCVYIAAAPTSIDLYVLMFKVFSVKMYMLLYVSVCFVCVCAVLSYICAFLSLCICSLSVSYSGHAHVHVCVIIGMLSFSLTYACSVRAHVRTCCVCVCICASHNLLRACLHPLSYCEWSVFLCYALESFHAHRVCCVICYCILCLSYL